MSRAGIEASPNPYSPPAAQAEADGELVGLQERQGARQLIAALGAAAAASNLAIMLALDRLQLSIAFRIVVTTLLLQLVYRRQTWARWLLVVLLAWSLLLNASALLTLAKATPLWIALQGSWFTLHLCMLVMLIAAPSIRALYRPRVLAPTLPDEDDPSEDVVGEDDDGTSGGAAS